MATSRQRAFRATSIKIGVFAVVMLLIFAALVIVFGEFRTGSSNSYKALFTSASQMKAGSKVRIAGIEVGRVTGVSVTHDNQAQISFDVDSKYPLPKSVRALIRYENLTGDRYLELAQGTGDPDQMLGKGSTIPESQTQPALDLDSLLGGFKPLFQTLQPNEVNQLSQSLIDVFQGQGPALTQLLSSTATFTNSLADRDQLVGEVIDNLNQLLGTIDNDRSGFDSSINLLEQLITGLNSQKDTIGNAITNASQVTNDLSGLLVDIRPDLQSTITKTGQLSQNLLDAKPFLNSLIPRLPTDFEALSNVGSYGSWLQVYICKVNIYFSAPGSPEVLWTAVNDNEPSSQADGGRCRTTQ